MVAEQLWKALAELRLKLGEAQRLATEAKRAGVQTTRVLNKRPIFSERDRTSDGRCILWIGRETVCRAHSLDTTQCETAVLSFGE